MNYLQMMVLTHLYSCSLSHNGHTATLISFSPTYSYNRRYHGIIVPWISGAILMAFSNVCTHHGTFIFVSVASPITRKSKKSTITETCHFPSLVLISVMSDTHLVSGTSTLKSRFNRSSDFLVSQSAFVIPFVLRPG